MSITTLTTAFTIHLRAVPVLGALVVIGLFQVSTSAAVDVVLRAAEAPVVQGAWFVVPDASAAGGSRLANPDAGQPRPPAPSAAPASYFELAFDADAGVPYHLWIRGRAEADSYDNDSVWVQFSDAVTQQGAPTWRIGTTSAASVVLEDCSGCGVEGWGWQDNVYGGVAPPIYFASSGTHTIRIQVREDGLSIDQIVLSSAAYLHAPPGPSRQDSTILTSGGAPPPVSGGALVRGPYLHQALAHSVVIVWASTDARPASVQVGAQRIPAVTTFYPSSRTGIADYYQHEAQVTGLAAGTEYAYQLFAGETPLTAGTDVVRTAPPTGSGAVRFIVFGDSGTGSPEQRALAARMNADAADLMLLAGDIAYGNGGGTGDASYATYQSWFFDIYAPMLRRRPVVPAMGNHDGRASNNWGQAYLDLFALPPDAGFGSFPDHAERYYSFDYGPVHVVVLDTELTFQEPSRRAAQLAWLEADLQQAAAQPWKIALYHRSPYSAGGEHGSDLAVRAAFGPLFERYGVQLSLSAHEHTFERTVPWRLGPASGQAVTYVVAGGGGAPVYPTGQDAWTAASASEHHYVRVTVNGCVALIEAVRASGALLDAQTLDRCAQASDAAAPIVEFTHPTHQASVAGTVTIDAFAQDDVRVEKVDLRIDGRLHGIDTSAPYAFTWDTAASGPGQHTLELRAYDIDGNQTSRSIVVSATAGPVSSDLPPGWQTQDVGAVGITGAASFAGGAFTVTGAGADIWGTADAFRFVHRPLAGDGAIVARVSSLWGADPWTKVGVMIRASSDASSAHALMLVSASRGLAFQRRTSHGATSTHTAGPATRAPAWVKLSRSGQVVTGWVSEDGHHWTAIGSDTIALPGSVLVGLAVTSHTPASTATGTFDSVTLQSAASGLPAGWQSVDVGAVGVPGSASAVGGLFTVRGAGADVWGTADAFHFVAQPIAGDADIVTRVTSVQGGHRWTKAGVMIRSSLDPSAAHGFALVSTGMGLAFQRRPVVSGTSIHTGADGAAPVWVKLSRRGTVLTASTSPDGVSWTVVGTDTLPAGPAYAGLAVTSHDAASLASATFDQTSLATP